MDTRAAALVRDLLAGPLAVEPGELALDATPLVGGLEAAAVHLVVARAPTGRTRRVVVKVAAHAAQREAAVYEALVARAGASLAPRLLAAAPLDEARDLLVLEAIRPPRVWPWGEVDLAATVVRAVAGFHDAARPHAPALPPWDYERELADSAASTAELLDRLRQHPAVASLARDGRRAVNRVVARLASLRAALMAATPAVAPIHGDVHPGNVLLRRRRRGAQPVLIDWARARLGSPLEDLSSWLQSLGAHAPEPRRRHDTLLATYLDARGRVERLDDALRAAYWVAGASNALAGALRYHLWVATRGGPAEEEAAGVRAAAEWLRVIRRADAWSRG